MTCSEVRYRLPDYLRGALVDDEMSAVAQHLRQCQDCPHELEALRQLFSRLQVPDTQEPVENYWTTLLSRIHERIEKRRQRAVPAWVPRFVFPVVVVVLVAFLVMQMFPTHQNDADHREAYEMGIRDVLGEMTEEELESLADVSFPEDVLRVNGDAEDRLTGQRESLEEVLENAENVFLYSEIDATTFATVMDDQEIERLVAHLDQKRFVR